MKAVLRVCSLLVYVTESKYSYLSVIVTAFRAEILSTDMQLATVRELVKTTLTKFLLTLEAVAKQQGNTVLLFICLLDIKNPWKKFPKVG
jgi:hypothetical protein